MTQEEAKNLRVGDRVIFQRSPEAIKYIGTITAPPVTVKSGVGILWEKNYNGPVTWIFENTGWEWLSLIVSEPLWAGWEV